MEPTNHVLAELQRITEHIKQTNKQTHSSVGPPNHLSFMQPSELDLANKWKEGFLETREIIMTINLIPELDCSSGAAF